MLVYGHPNYYTAARRSIRSILDRSPFDLFLVVDSKTSKLPVSHRIRMKILERERSTRHDRAYPFLLKFDALRACLEEVIAEWILMVDADTLLATQIQQQDICNVLDGFTFGMVEQSGILGSSMTLIDLLQHYKNNILPWFDSNAIAPDPEEFRYFNSGVILGHRSEFERIVPWALDTIHSPEKSHEIGVHMIADQDYFQYWTNTLHPGMCRSLPWNWNHCEHWDLNFPREDAIFFHFSNFCNGPTRKMLLRMAWLDHKTRRRDRNAFLSKTRF